MNIHLDVLYSLLLLYFILCVAYHFWDKSVLEYAHDFSVLQNLKSVCYKLDDFRDFPFSTLKHWKVKPNMF